MILNLELNVTKKGAYLVVAGYSITKGKYSEYTIQNFDIFENELKDSLKCDVI